MFLIIIYLIMMNMHHSNNAYFFHRNMRATKTRDIFFCLILIGKLLVERATKKYNMRIMLTNADTRKVYLSVPVLN